ncbi:MAG: DMT family transporter, partial [Gammaproteobacteria bacterium]
MRAYISTILAGICIGLVGLLVKLMDASVPPMTLSFLRALIGALFLLLLLPLIDTRMFRVSRTDLKSYMILGMLMAINFSLFIAANSFAPVSNVVLLFYTFPFWLAIISHLFLKERVTKLHILCLVIAFSGVLVINPFNDVANFGNVLALLNALDYAVIYAYMRHIDKRHTIGVVFWFMLFAAVFLSPAPLVFGFGAVSWNYLWVLVLGVVSTGLAYLFLNHGLKKLNALTSSLIMMTTEPLVAITVAIVFIGEIVTVNVLV